MKLCYRIIMDHLHTERASLTSAHAMASLDQVQDRVELDLDLHLLLLQVDKMMALMKAYVNKIALRNCFFGCFVVRFLLGR